MRPTHPITMPHSQVGLSPSSRSSFSDRLKSLFTSPTVVIASVIVLLLSVGLVVSKNLADSPDVDGAGTKRIRIPYRLPPATGSPFSTLNASRSFLAVQSAFAGCKIDETGRILCAPEFYFLPHDYDQRYDNRYDVRDASAGDSMELSWQYRVYESAAALAQRLKATRVIDVGCGSGSKLAGMRQALGDTVELVCIDFGANLDRVRKEFPFLRTVEHDLNTPIADVLPRQDLQSAIIINADNAEHVLHSHTLFAGFKSWMDKGAAAVVVSTPDRERTRADLGDKIDKVAPLNEAHIREWTLCELLHFYSRYGPAATFAGWTENNKRDKQLWTSFIVSISPQSSKETKGEVGIDGLYEPIPTPVMLECIHRMQEGVEKDNKGRR